MDLCMHVSSFIYLSIFNLSWFFELDLFNFWPDVYSLEDWVLGFCCRMFLLYFSIKMFAWSWNLYLYAGNIGFLKLDCLLVLLFCWINYNPKICERNCAWFMIIGRNMCWYFLCMRWVFVMCVLLFLYVVVGFFF